MFHTYEDLVARSQHIRPLRTLEGHTDVVRSVAFSPDGRWLASGSNDNMLRLWEVATGLAISTLQGHTNPVLSVAFSPDGRWLASGSSDKTVRLWEVATTHTVSAFEGHTGTIYSVTYSPDGRWLASGSNDRTVRLWEVATERAVTIFEGHTNEVNSIAYSSDGRWLASGSDDRTVRLWEVATGRAVTIFEGHTNRVNSVAFSPDGRWLASGSHDETVRLWEVATGRAVNTLQGHTGMVNSVLWTPDGELLISTSVVDHTVRFWHAGSGQLISRLPQAENWSHVNSRPIMISFGISPDGRLLVTYSADTLNTIRLWDISALDVGLTSTTTATTGELSARLAVELQPALRSQLRSLPLSHVRARDFPAAQAASWLRGAAAANWPLPLALARDLGLLLSQPAGRRVIERPAYLPYDMDTSGYQAFLERVANHPLVRQLPGWQPPLSEAVLGIVLARLVEGLELPEEYRVPTGAAGARWLRDLQNALASADPAEVWRETPVEERPSWEQLLSATAIARLEGNLRGLDADELRFLARYGAPLAGSPDPRDLLALLHLTGLPPAARLALSQVLRLLPQLGDLHSRGGLQTYPEGGYDGLAQQGSLDSLLPGESAYPPDMFLHRVLNHEALYYGRERPREQRRDLAYLVGQVSWGLGGDGQVLLRALLLALGQALGQRGYEVLYSLVGAEVSEPRALDKPGEVGQVLYSPQRGAVNSERVLQGVLGHLRGWRERYRGRQVCWVLAEDFDADEVEAHRGWYEALAAEASQQVWYVRVGGTPVPTHASNGHGNGHKPPAGQRPAPVSARYFGRWQVVESQLLWQPLEMAGGHNGIHHF